MDFGRQNKSFITKLRVKGENLENVAARLNFERLFAAAEFSPAGLPPDAVLCIKKISDPKPSTLRLSYAELQFSENWRKSVSREIEKLYQKAYRPLREFIPAEAESVLFSDQSELLACLAEDFCEGILAQRWWWKSLFPTLNRAQTVAQIWLDSVKFAPRALQLLARKRKAARFTARLETDEAELLLTEILQVFGLQKLRNALVEPLKKSEIEAVGKRLEKGESVKFTANDTNRKSAAPLSPFVNLLSEIKAEKLNFTKENLLGIGILLAESPRIVRSAEFAEQVKTYRAEIEFRRKTKTQTVSIINKIEPEKLPEIIEKKDFLETKKRNDETSIFQKAGKISAAPDKPAPPKKVFKTFDEIVFSQKKKAEPAEEKEAAKPVRQTKKKPTIFSFEKTVKEEKKERSKPKTPEKRLQKRAAPKTPEIENAFDETEHETVDLIVFTRLGGVFYLLNLGIFLELYRDFTENLLEEIALDIWDFVALLAFEFLGEEAEKDSVWRLLDDLSGRADGENPGDGFSPENDWRIPAKWLETFRSDRKWFWFTAKNRLIVRHPANFSVIDVELSDQTEIQLEKELEKYREFFDETENVETAKFAENPPFESWLKNLTEYVKARLLQALNLETTDELNEVLFKKTARVSVSAAHLDVNFSLADLPLAVRFSGLDRDPGWIPAVGKFVKFHFV